MTYPFDLGTFSWANSENAEAQAWFDRGMVWMFGFNHEEAICCFEKTLAHDPDCTMARWAIAFGLGPNYNKPWDVFTEKEKGPVLARCHEMIHSAKPKTALEQALLDALALRYPTDPDIEKFHPWNAAFADAMRGVYEDHPDDLNVTMIYAEAMMNISPWQIWDLKTGDPTQYSQGPEIKRILDRAFEQPQAWEHPHLLHLYIHLMEMSQTPEAAKPHGDKLTGLVPDSGHLMHMATHIDVLCGDYDLVVERNHIAAAVDQKYKDYAGGENFYTLYRLHNLHFEAFGAMFLARPTVALAAADALRAELPDEVVRTYPELFEAFVASHVHVLIRFGMWEEVLLEPLPHDTETYIFTSALTRYARAVALANLGRHEEAQIEAKVFDDLVSAMPEGRMLFQNSAADVLGVAEAMMRGELEFKKGDQQSGLDHLRRAVAMDDGLMYEEPWAWPQPTRHALGALLMEAKQFEEAEAVYRADLGLDPELSRALQNPGNIWALKGLHECLERRSEADLIHDIQSQLDKANAAAEISVKASCYCRKVA